jgi:hexulose-6-phosphate isomerase
MPTPIPPARTFQPARATPTPIGIMQGRLVPPDAGRFQSFPRERWREEFSRAKAAGIDYIEWIVDAHGEDINPLLTSSGLSEIETLKHEHKVLTSAICADWFMDYPFLRCTPEERRRREEFLVALLPLAKQIGARYIVLPFVDGSRIETDEQKDVIVALLKRCAPIAEAHNVELHLETDLNPEDFAALLARLLHPCIRANYDVGNSSGLGYIAREEFAAYGARIGSIHIKDRYRKPEGGFETRPLGQGSADFDDVFAAMHRVGYNHGLTLQVARGQDGDEVAFIREQAAFVRRYWA